MQPAGPRRILESRRHDRPERYEPWPTVASRFRRWTREGLWDRILEALPQDLDATGQIEWDVWCIDGSHVRVLR